MISIPLQAIPAQTVNVVLNGQSCTLNVYQKFWGLFIDVLVNNMVIIQGVICQNANFIVRSFYLGFSGDLVFFDTHGASDPDYAGLAGPTPPTMTAGGATLTTGGSPPPAGGGRFMLIYLAPGELPEDYGQNPFDPDALADIADWEAAFGAIGLPAGTQMLSPGSLA